MLEEEFAYYRENQEKFAKENPDKFVVIQGKNVVGFYNSEKEAYDEMIKNNKLGTFLIQQCLPENHIYTQTFLSRAIF